ncbi:hypothetical protein HETIRDRAFT_124951 [Heterobasidion irregulare TC 32-1]|uniref:Uncharacterized protein n=1 Tax=Heterobasidion irregulare (strain TC 32-1) TaxID=747525 RepID=W4K7J0_HETIT|nr:uncharacterized protein HETIRDRAFT_124951 [Heterobasidion irregulare TC 32-1]ETW81300.1 hypothetical protein HETIRDRAFT_124951 [Heterobasidion irregulare TC 32-1]
MGHRSPCHSPPPACRNRSDYRYPPPRIRVWPPHLFMLLIPMGDANEGEAYRCLERAAYFNFVPTLYKLGHT